MGSSSSESVSNGGNIIFHKKHKSKPVEHIHQTINIIPQEKSLNRYLNVPTIPLQIQAPQPIYQNHVVNTLPPQKLPEIHEVVSQDTLDDMQQEHGNTFLLPDPEKCQLAQICHDRHQFQKPLCNPQNHLKYIMQKGNNVNKCRPLPKQCINRNIPCLADKSKPIIHKSLIADKQDLYCDCYQEDLNKNICGNFQ